jgi:hypothetical protein
MKQQDSFDDFLAEHLREAQTYLPDDGFTASVISVLPAPNTRKPLAEYLIIGVPLLIISLLVFSQFPFTSVFGGVWYWLIQVDTWGWLQMGVGVSACLTLAATVWFVRASSESL